FASFFIYSVSHNLVESVAHADKGCAQFVTNNERMDKKVIGMLKNALRPPIKDYEITWTDDNFLESIDTKELEPIQNKPTISFMSDGNSNKFYLPLYQDNQSKVHALAISISSSQIFSVHTFCSPRKSVHQNQYFI